MWEKCEGNGEFKNHSWIQEKAANTNSINNMVNSDNSESTIGARMKDEILSEALQILRAKNIVMNKKLEDEVSSAIANLNEEFVEMDNKVNCNIKAAEKRITDGINDNLKKIIYDVSADKNFETLRKNVKDLKAKNDKLKKEITTVRHWVDNWRSEVNKINVQNLEETKKDMNTKVEAIEI